jgi:hypothetical protein
LTNFWLIKLKIFCRSCRVASCRLQLSSQIVVPEFSCIPRS